MYFHHSPSWLKSIFPQITWNVPGEEKNIYLSFDDGPDPDVTPQVLELLKKYNAKATFFCIGENVLKHRDLFSRIQNEKHTVGNHTFYHINGWKSGKNDYIADVEKCNQVFRSKLFRPPYGKFTPAQLKVLTASYKVVMWDVLSGDFDLHLQKEKCLEKVLKYTKSGSIVVFHDTAKSAACLLYVLPKVLDYFAGKGFVFKSISE